ncbi:hypothetical protein GUJ93_ZPchr0004g40452 [Zizania palustris]|uniref:SNARE associated Golgi protein family n=1 Tax=Zizania palustris TaxID=103762 RepID=A0A8J5VZS8_ZIZPA|nr:hypothetical protein GUJ93_ZPchr0004g40452 [Zizania palustris]
MGKEERFPVWEASLGAGVAAAFAVGLVGVYLSMPDSDYSFLKLPRNLEELQTLTGHLENYTSDYTIQVLVGYCSVYIFMQTFMIPGTIFMSLLAGALFGQLRGVALVVFAASAGASSCFFLSKLIGKPLVFSLWPDKLMFFQKQVSINTNVLNSNCSALCFDYLIRDPQEQQFIADDATFLSS